MHLILIEEGEREKKTEMQSFPTHRADWIMLSWTPDGCGIVGISAHDPTTTTGQILGPLGSLIICEEKTLDSCKFSFFRNETFFFKLHLHQSRSTIKWFNSAHVTATMPEPLNDHLRRTFKNICIKDMVDLRHIQSNGVWLSSKTATRSQMVR